MSIDPKDALRPMADGTVKQRNLLSGTEVWTVPGRGHRPLAVPPPNPRPLDPGQSGSYCAFCENNYLATPPEKSRIVRSGDEWVQLEQLAASQLFETRAEFRRIPNLFEIVSYNYWNLNHGHQPSLEQHQRMAQYLSDPLGYDHVISVVKARLKASGMDEQALAAMEDSNLLPHATGFFSGGHDVIVARRHYLDGAADDSQLASAGSLTPEEHRQYFGFTAKAIGDLYQLNPAVRYVSAFQNWLKPAGASFDHLHKQLVAIDEYPVQTQEELARLEKHPDIYDQILKIAVTRGLILARNRHAVAIAGFGHRFPGVAIWPLGAPVNPWEAAPEVVEATADLTHAIHAATGAQVPCNEEWYYRPPSVRTPMRWRLLIKWRISTLAGFEGGTRIYLNTIDPWGVRDRLAPRLRELREAGAIAPMDLGEECKISVAELGGV